MNTQKTFRRKELAATISFLLAAYAGSALAQDQDADADASQSASGPIEEVVVTASITQSIMNSVDTKRQADSIVDVVDAGALGVLPDQSIADALGRVPGVTTIRDSGQSSQLNIRGMNGDFIQTTLNGREQVSTAGFSEATRWSSFDQYPAELISQAAVYKAPKASQIEGGVAGVVELKTADPLQAPNPHNFVASARLSLNDAADDYG
jgi:phosphoribosylformimino-5-aminoimidazole carboxamide ribotide isomerase